VREEVEIDRLGRSGGPKLRHLRPHLLGSKHPGGQGTEPARICDRDRKLGIHAAGHRRQ
jgi:hypothetical protein